MTLADTFNSPVGAGDSVVSESCSRRVSLILEGQMTVLTTADRWLSYKNQHHQDKKEVDIGCAGKLLHLLMIRALL